jgi:pimeloyl-ACP methyl ester carboxylesterase
MQKLSVTVGRFEIPCAIAGSGPHSVVCVNGMQQTMAAWRSLVKRFIREPRYRVVLFDFPNQGRAIVRSGTGEVGLMEQVEVLHAVVAHVSGERPVDLLGGSWGALVAAAFAATSPRWVRRMVLGSFQARANRRLRELARRGRALVEAGKGSELADLFIRAFGSGMSQAHQAAVRAQFCRLPRERLWQMHEQGTLLLSATDLGTLVDLQRITAETLIVNGASDAIVDASDVEGTVDRIPGAELHVVPGAGHFLHFERPEILDIYVEFLNRPVAAASAA